MTITLTGLTAGLAFVAGFAVICAVLDHQAQRALALRITFLEEDTMAQFDSLNEDVTAIKSEVGALADRIEAAVAAANNDDADQAAVDAADAELRSSLAAMRALAQAPAPEEPPADEPPAEPTA